jgi:hypothetical protein
MPVKEVENLVRQKLLARYQAYRTKGLSGVAPYERGTKRGQVFAGLPSILAQLSTGT